MTELMLGMRGNEASGEEADLGEPAGKNHLVVLGDYSHEHRS